MTTEEVVRRGKDLYKRQISPHLNAEDSGRYVVVDVETGDYLMGDDYAELSARLHARRAGAALYATRIGEAVLGRIGKRTPSLRG